MEAASHFLRNVWVFFYIFFLIWRWNLLRKERKGKKGSGSSKLVKKSVCCTAGKKKRSLRFPFLLPRFGKESCAEYFFFLTVAEKEAKNVSVTKNESPKQEFQKFQDLSTRPLGAPPSLRVRMHVSLLPVFNAMVYAICVESRARSFQLSLLVRQWCQWRSAYRYTCTHLCIYDAAKQEKF